MSNIIDITSLDGFKANQNEKIIDRELFHPNPEVMEGNGKKHTQKISV